MLLQVIGCQSPGCDGIHMKGTIAIIITIIITAIKPENSSPEMMGIKRITVRRQRGLPNGGNIRVTESQDQGWERHPSKDPEENS